MTEPMTNAHGDDVGHERTSDAQAQSDGASRRVTLPIATGLVVGTMIGSGVFLLPSALAPYGTVSLVGFALTALGAVVVALVFAGLAARRPARGGPYAYAREAFGDFVGFQTAWNYWISLWTGVAAVAVAFTGYLGAVIPALPGNRGAQAAVAAAAVLTLTAANLRGVREGGLVSTVLALAKVIPLVALAVIGLFMAEVDLISNWRPADETTLAAIGITATLTLWAFLGLETASVPADDVVNPRRTIPRATVGGTLVVGIIYLAVTAAVFGLVPLRRLQESEAPLADAAEVALGGWAGTVIAVAACLATLGTINGLILCQGQVVCAAAADGLAPRGLERLSASGVPDRALLISSSLAAVLAALAFTSGTLVEAFTFIILVATLTALVPFTFTAAAQLKLLLVDRIPAARWMLPVAALAFVYAIGAIVGAGHEVVFYGFLVLFAGIPVYLIILRQRGHAATDAPRPGE